MQCNTKLSENARKKWKYLGNFEFFMSSTIETILSPPFFYSHFGECAQSITVN